MVLAELGQRVTAALASLSAAPVIDDAVLDACLKDIAAALLQSDVNVRLVAGLRSNVKKRVNMADLGRGLNKQRIIEKVGVRCWWSEKDWGGPLKAIEDEMGVYQRLCICVRIRRGCSRLSAH